MYHHCYQSESDYLEALIFRVKIRFLFSFTPTVDDLPVRAKQEYFEKFSQ